MHLRVSRCIKCLENGINLEKDKRKMEKKLQMEMSMKSLCLLLNVNELDCMCANNLISLKEHFIGEGGHGNMFNL